MSRVPLLVLPERAPAGRFEEADKGTLFLDELASLSMGAQERLFRAVE